MGVKLKKIKNTKIRKSARSAARRCAHVKGEKLARWPYVGIVLTDDITIREKREHKTAREKNDKGYRGPDS